MTSASSIKDGTSPALKDLLKINSNGISKDSLSFLSNILLISPLQELVLFGNFFYKV